IDSLRRAESKETSVSLEVGWADGGKPAFEVGSYDIICHITACRVLAIVFREFSRGKMLVWRAQQPGYLSSRRWSCCDFFNQRIQIDRMRHGEISGPVWMEIVYMTDAIGG